MEITSSVIIVFIFRPGRV